MNVPDSRPADPAAPVPAFRLTLREIAPQLRQMLADEDWLPACHDVAELDQLLYRIDTDTDFADTAPAPDLAMMLTAHQDYCSFRRALAARVNAPDDQPLRITPDEWLYMRLHDQEKADARRPYAQFRQPEGRFRIVD